ncbi:methyl-accepting chemotaxis protein [Thiomicrorhabdus sp. Milos-T2]|uniref:methyl-accepting chemotaxis protein n=1 Tax=Thiomicrorhabdus sp. Milos-T2 TaxID=90814 RepID=UPI000493F793|nr:methyl-accepting chemotaxis protein [Thiomicrorhabdus sp. Milos-T2]
MSIKMKMILGIIGTLSLFLISTLATQWIVNQTNKTITVVVDDNGLKLELLDELKNTALHREIQLLNLALLDPDSDQYDADLANSKKHLKESASTILNLFNKLNSLDFTKTELDVYDEIKQTMASSNAAFASFMTAIDEGFQSEAVEIMQEEFHPKYKEFSNNVVQLQEKGKENNRQAIANLLEQESASVMYLWIAFGVLVIAFSIVGSMITQGLMKSINSMVSTMVKISETGETKHRIKVYGNDELAKASKAFNHLLDDINNAIFGVNNVLNSIAKGDFSRQVESDLKGDFLQMKLDVNTSIKQIDSTMNVLEKTAHNFRQGKLMVHKDDSIQLEGKFSDVIYDLDRSAIRMKGVVESIAGTLNHLAHGDFSARSEADARGDFIPLKDSLNVTLSDLENFVNEVAKVQSAISDGDLTLTVKGTYSGKMAVLKDSLNSSVKNTAVMVAKVEGITKSVVHGVDDMAKGNSDVSRRVQEQAAALEQTSSSMAEMTTAVRHNAENANHAKDRTLEAREQLESGLETMNKALVSMEEMSEANQKINEITSLIDGIAFQTNLLALNAAVEAARAGENGRGFAVVAGEVRNLAGKSAEAAGDIKYLIENSVKISQESGLYVRQTSDALTKINESMHEVSEMVTTISATSDEQSSGLQQVNKAVASMDEMTQRNALVVEQAATSSEELLGDADILKEQVNRFIIDKEITRRTEKLIHSQAASQFEKMIEAHLAWKGKIRAFVEGVDIGVSYEVATDHTACILGKWYYSEGQELMNLPLMAELGEEHMQMHQGIKTVMDAKSIDDVDSVEKGLSAVDLQSEKVVEILYKLIDQVV